MSETKEITISKIERDSVSAALFGRIIRQDLEKDFDTLAIALSKQTEVELEKFDNLN